MEKNKALQIFNQYDGKAIVCARREEIEEISPQFEPIVTVIELKKDDFAFVGGDNYYPQKALQNRMSDAAGVKFTDNCGTKSIGSWMDIDIRQVDGVFEAIGEYTVIGWAQGYRLGPDGQPRTSSVCEYEFNVVDRCNMDSFLGKYPPKSIIEARKKLLEFKKFATRRASTGAQLAVIRELTGVPTAFKKGDIEKPMIISQVVESNAFKMDVAKQLMKTPDGRESVAGAIFGTSKALFGQVEKAPVIESPPVEKDVSPTEDFSEPETSAKDFDSDFDTTEPEMELKDAFLIELERYKHSSLPEKAKLRIEDMLNKPDEYTTEDIEKYLKMCKEKTQGGAA